MIDARATPVSCCNVSRGTLLFSMVSRNRSEIVVPGLALLMVCQLSHHAAPMSTLFKNCNKLIRQPYSLSSRPPNAWAAENRVDSNRTALSRTWDWHNWKALPCPSPHGPLAASPDDPRRSSHRDRRPFGKHGSGVDKAGREKRAFSGRLRCELPQVAGRFNNATRCNRWWTCPSPSTADSQAETCSFLPRRVRLRDSGAKLSIRPAKLCRTATKKSIAH